MRYFTDNVVEDLTQISYCIAGMCAEYNAWDKDNPNIRCCSLHEASARLQDIAKQLQQQQKRVLTEQQQRALDDGVFI